MEKVGSNCSMNIPTLGYIYLCIQNAEAIFQ